MNPGDKVRSKHSTEEGIVTKRISEKEVEVEIEEGFRIPFLIRDLVMVSSGNDGYLTKNKNTEEVSISEFLDRDVLLAFIPVNDRKFDFVLVNDTSYVVHFNIGKFTDTSFEGIMTGRVETQNFITIYQEDIQKFEEWPEFVLQLTFFAFGPSKYKNPLVKKMKFKANSFFKSEKLIPIINKKCYHYSLYQNAESIKIEQLTQLSMRETKSTSKNKVLEQVELLENNTIDLHAEVLFSDYESMKSREILEKQLAHFYNKLELAIAQEMEEIIFIHGLGNGVLKHEIHKILSKRKDIKFYKDAHKERFGYGATLVRLK